MNNCTLHIHLYDLVPIGVMFLGVGAAGLLWSAGSYRGTLNRLLAIAMMSAVFHLAGIFAARFHLPFPAGQPLLILGPLLFLYIRGLAGEDTKLAIKDLLHFLPFVLSGVWPFGLWCAPIQLLCYLYFGHQRLALHDQRKIFIGGDRYRLELRWIQWSLGSIGMVTLLYLFCVLSNIAGHYIYGIILVILMIGLSGMAFFRNYESPDLRGGFLRPAQPAGLREKGIWLKRELKLERYYQDPDLSLPALAEKLDIHPNELSRIVNTVLQKNFNDLINEYRVMEVRRKMADPAYDHFTLLGIAFGSGFNSKTTFNRVFKEMTGKTPAEYKNEIKKEGPDHKMGRWAAPATIVSQQSKRNIMLKEHFKIAWRHLKRNRAYTGVNIAGLSIGIAACILIFLVVRYETSFDNYHAKKDRTYRILRETSDPDGIHSGAGTPIPLTPGLRTEFPQLEQAADIMQNGGSSYSVGDTRQGGTVKKFKVYWAYYAEPSFFRIFDIQWLAGDKHTALSAPNTMVLSRQEAERFFGDWRTAVGKMVRYENTTDMQVTGVFEDTPANTDMPLKLIISWSTLVNKGGGLARNADDWISTFGAKNSFIVLPQGADQGQMDKALAAFAQRRTPAPYNKGMTYRLQALSDIHYDTESGVYSGHTFSKELIRVIGLIGLFLLIIACVNFINLATAQAVNRSKEVGVRKVLGSDRTRLAIQFISETFLVTLFSVSVAVLIAVIALPMLNGLLSIQLNRAALIAPAVLLFLIGVVITVTLLAGLYPALVLSGFDPIKALRNKVNAGKASGISLRRVLVVGQFCIAQFLVIGTLTLIYQMDHFKSRSLGFDKETVVTVPYPADSSAKTRIGPLVDQLTAQAGVKAISLSTYAPSEEDDWYSDFKFDHSPKPVDFAASLKWADPGFFKLYHMEFLAGGPYRRTDTVTGYVINETLLNKLGIRDPGKAIGKYIILWDRQKMYAPITGVVRDFNTGSLRNAIPPVLMGAWKDRYAKMNIKLDPRQVRPALQAIEDRWNKAFPEGIYDYRFLDQTIANFYRNEDQLATLYKIFAGIAIFISCLGLYGLVSFMAVQRTKEVGIRKTLGASAGHIIYLFSKEFTVLILVAFALSAPVGYYLMNKWLQDYAYRITLGPGIFIQAVLISVAIAWISVGVKAIKAAMADPVKSLRSE